MEATLSNKHVLIINPGFKSNPPDRSLDDLPKIKSAENLVIAPHPFFPQSKSLKSLFFDYIPYYDAIEYSHFYHKWLNYNKKAIMYARQYQLPLVGTSDCHFLWEFGKTYSLIEAEKNTGAIIAAVKAGKVEICSSPLSAWQMSRVIFKSMQMNLYRKRITP
jgi:predicted metal-dependent phosphoesterase TrpH